MNNLHSVRTLSPYETRPYSGGNVHRVSMLIFAFAVLALALSTGCKSTPPPREGMCFIPHGTYRVGSPDGDPRPETDITAGPFYIDKCEVTNGDYRRFCLATSHAQPPHWAEEPAASLLTQVGAQDPAALPLELRQQYDAWARLPVSNVAFADAQAYAASVNKRLPTEEEWEAAARGHEGLRYPWGNEFFPDRCNSSASGLGQPEPVGSHPNGASPFGVLDMAGNVWEFTSSLLPGSTDQRIIRGGSFDLFELEPNVCKRGTIGATEARPTVGFRCVADVQQ